MAEAEESTEDIYKRSGFAPIVSWCKWWLEIAMTED